MAFLRNTTSGTRSNIDLRKSHNYENDRGNWPVSFSVSTNAPALLMESTFMGRSPKKVNHGNGNRSSGKKGNVMHFLDTGSSMRVFIAGMVIDIPFDGDAGMHGTSINIKS